MRLSHLLIFFGLCLAPAQPRRLDIAMLTDLKGTLRCQSQGRELFDTLQEGQVFEAPRGSHWTLSFAPAGFRVSGEEGTFQILPQGVKALQGSPTHRTSAPWLRSLSWGALPPVPKGQLENPDWLMQSVSESSQVELCWQATEPVQEVELVVEELPDHRQVFKGQAPASHKSVSLTLAAGHNYVLHLRGFSPPEWSGTRSHSFRVLSSREAEAVRKMEKEASHVELCFYYQQLGLTHRARALAQQLLERYPEQETLKILAGQNP